MTEVDVSVTRTLKGTPQPSVTFVYDAFGDKRPSIGSLRGEQLFFRAIVVKVIPVRKDRCLIATLQMLRHRKMPQRLARHAPGRPRS